LLRQIGVEELADGRTDLVGVGFEREMARCLG
jgi:hypothetical protein